MRRSRVDLELAQPTLPVVVLMENNGFDVPLLFRTESGSMLRSLPSLKVRYDVLGEKIIYRVQRVRQEDPWLAGGRTSRAILEDERGPGIRVGCIERFGADQR